MKTSPGEVWLADLGTVAKVRPVVIVSRQDDDPPRDLAIYVPVTSQYRGSAYEIDLGRPSFLSVHSFANTQGIASIPGSRLARKLGMLSPDLLARVKSALVYALDI